MSIFIETQSLSVALTFSLHIKNIYFLLMFHSRVSPFVWRQLIYRPQRADHASAIQGLHSEKQYQSLLV